MVRMQTFEEFVAHQGVSPTLVAGAMPLSDGDLK